MIYDMASVLLQYADSYEVKLNSPFKYNGITYNSESVVGNVMGIMTPLTDEAIEYFSNIKLGYSIAGLQSFYVPGTEEYAILNENDIVVDSDGVEWIVLPKNKTGKGSNDWMKHGNFMEYVVARKTLTDD